MALTFRKTITRARLVLRPIQVTLVRMDKPWYRNLFTSAQEPAPDSSQPPSEPRPGDAQFGRGLQFACGTGETQDYSQAAEWYLKAADQGHALAQFNLGVMYSEGQGLPKDPAIATAWFQKAALKGDAGAQYHLGMSQYRASLWGPSSEAVEARTEAYKWLTLADAQGYKNSVATCEKLNLSMTHEQVADANRRAAAFNPETPV